MNKSVQKEKKIIAHTNKWFHQKEEQPFFLKVQLYGLFNKDEGFRKRLKQLFDSLKESKNLNDIPDTCSPPYSLLIELNKNTDKKTQREIDGFIKKTGLRLNSIVEDIYFSYIFFNSKYWEKAISGPNSKRQLMIENLELIEEISKQYVNDPHLVHLKDSELRSYQKHENRNDFDKKVLIEYTELPILFPAFREGMGELLDNLYTIELNNLSFTWDISNETPAGFKKRIIEQVECEVNSQISNFVLAENATPLTKLGKEKHTEWLFEKIKGCSWARIRIKYGVDKRETVISGVKRLAKIIGLILPRTVQRA